MPVFWWWKGSGYLAGVIPLVFFFLGAFGIGFVAGEEWRKAHPESVGVILCIAGIVVWFVGRKLNGRLWRNSETNEQITSKAKHTVYFFPMEYAGFFWFIFGVALFFGLYE
jgi:hypothetical protein